MPSKNGFGNSRTPMMKKVSYGSAMHYKNPIKFSDDWSKESQSEGTNSGENEVANGEKSKSMPTPGEMHYASMKKFNSKLPEGDRRRMAES